MANQIRLKRASGSDPGASDLVTGELAVRTDTGKLFTKKDDNSVTEIGVTGNAATATKLDGIESGATADQTKSDIDGLGIAASTAATLATARTIAGVISSITPAPLESLPKILFVADTFCIFA